MSEQRIQRVRVYQDGSWKFKDDVGWSRLTDCPPRDGPFPSDALLRRMFNWAYLCATGGGYEGIDRRRNRPAAYYAEVTTKDIVTNIQ